MILRREGDVPLFPAMKTKARFLDILQWAIVALIFVFLGRTVLQDWVHVKETSFFLKGGSLFWATLIFAASYFVQVWAWYLITVKLGIAISIGETLKSWFCSQLGKYLPGKVWLLLGRFYFYGSNGKSKGAISIALYFETVIGVVAAGILFLATLIFFEEARPFYSGKGVWWLIIPFALAFVSLYPPILETILNLILRRLKREPVSVSISYLEILWILFISLLAWIMGGGAFYLFTNAVFAIPSDYILFLTGSLAFASFLGLIAIFAPSGLGVREGVLVYLLSSIMPGSVAVIVSVLTRIWMTLIEIGLAGMIYLVHFIRNRNGKGKLHG